MRNLSLILFSILTLLWRETPAQSGPEKDLPLQKGHPETIRKILWSPDGSKLLSFSQNDSALRAWDAATGRAIWAASTAFIQDDLEPAALRNIDWSADGKYIASVSENGKVQLWDGASGKSMWQHELYKYADLRYDGPYDSPLVKFSPGGDVLATVTAPLGMKGEIKLWNVETGTQLRSIPADYAIALVFSADGKMLKAGDSNGKTTTWDVKSGTLVSSGRVINSCGSPQKISNAWGYSPDLNYFVGLCGNRWILTDTRTRRLAGTLPVRDGDDSDWAFSGDSRVFAVREDSDFKTLDLSNKRVTRITNKLFHALQFALDPSGGRLAKALGYDSGIQIVDVKTGNTLGRPEAHPGTINSLAFSPDGKRLASGSSDRVVRIWDSESGKLLYALAGHTSEVINLEFIDGGNTLLSKSVDETIGWAMPSGRKVREVETGAELPDRIQATAFNTDPRLVLENLGDDKPFRLTQFQNGGTSTREFTGLTQIQGFKFTPDGKRFISAAYFSPLQLWDIESGKKVRDFDIGYSWDNAIAVGPDGKTFAAGGKNQNILMYDIESGRLIWSLFPIDREEMAANRAKEARRVKFLRDKAEAVKIADEKTAAFADKVTLAFEHYGDVTPIDKMPLMAEPAEPVKSKVIKDKATATAIWLRLENRSPLPISLPTRSFYLYDRNCKFLFPKGAKLGGMCDKREIGLFYGLEDASGTAIPYGTDVEASVVLMPGNSARFGVPREVLKNGQRIVFSYKFQNENAGKTEDYGTARALKFGEADMPR